MAQTAAAVAPGALVLGRYRPLRPLGSGGSGSVWLAREEGAGREVALKIVPREGNAGSRAEREAVAAARLRHERCLRASALARDRNHVYIVYEYVPGRTLRETMRAGQLDDAAAVEAAAQILEGLAHAHAQGIVHRDVKPANVLLADGPQVRVKLFDFGLAVMREEDSLTAAGDIPGTLAYMSPERLKGEPAGPEADVWAVGVLLWEALTGSHPFWNGSLLETARRIQSGAPSLRVQRPDLPRALVHCVDRALSPEPARRPSAAGLASRLRQVAADRRRGRQRASRRRLSLAPTRPRALAAAAAAVFAGWSAAILPFFPSGWPLGIAAAAAVLALASERFALAFALAVPILPLGNYALSLAVLYALVATAWLALSWREPRTGLFLTTGPLLAPLGALGLLPVAAQVVVSPVRRALQVGAAVLAAATVAGAPRLAGLGIAASERPAEAGGAVAGALSGERQVIVQALVLAATAVALPFARSRGPWAAAGLAAFMIAGTLLAAPLLPALPLVVAAWAIGLGLVLEPHVRARRGPETEEPTAETTLIVRPLEPVRGVAGPG